MAVAIEIFSDPAACCLMECPWTCIPDVSSFDCNTKPGNWAFQGPDVVCVPPEQGGCSGTPLRECCKGDTNQDGLRDGLDIRSFVSIAASGLTPGDDPGTNCEPLDPQTWCATDTNGDANIDDLDVETFVALLLEGGPCAAPGS